MASSGAAMTMMRTRTQRAIRLAPQKLDARDHVQETISCGHQILPPCILAMRKGEDKDKAKETTDQENPSIPIRTAGFKDRMDAATQEVARIVPVVLPFTKVGKWVGLTRTLFAHETWPNGLRL